MPTALALSILVSQGDELLDDLVQFYNKRTPLKFHINDIYGWINRSRTLIADVDASLVEQTRNDAHEGPHDTPQYFYPIISQTLSILKAFEKLPGMKEQNVVQAETSSTQSALGKVFIVHGHDEGVKETVARFLEKLGLDVVILHERPNKGRTIITKFLDEAKEVGFAVVLLTPDDHAGTGDKSQNPQGRARQNVIFELGFFIGSLGAHRVVALLKGQVERPSDFDGVIYIRFDDSNWKVSLANELEEAGYSIDWKKIAK